jgi:hypothetical protein
MAPLPAVVPVEPAVHDDAAVSAALVSQGAGDEFTSDDDASGESEGSADHVSAREDGLLACVL